MTGQIQSTITLFQKDFMLHQNRQSLIKPLLQIQLISVTLLKTMPLYPILLYRFLKVTWLLIMQIIRRIIKEQRYGTLNT